MTMNREWRYLKAMKRAGRAYAEEGVEGTQPGELTVPCPTCPRPGINLPDDWDSNPDHEAYVIYCCCSDPGLINPVTCMRGFMLQMPISDL